MANLIEAVRLTASSKFREDQRLQIKKKQCTDRGGTWDEATGTCKMPQAGPQQREPQRETIGPQQLQEDVKQTEVAPPQNVKLSDNERLTAEAKGQTIVTDAEGNQSIQTPEDLAQAKKDIRILQSPSIGTDVLIEQQKQAAAIQAEKDVLIETGSPERRQLDPNVTEAEKRAVTGPLVQMLADKVLGFFGKDVTDGLNPEELRTAALTEIERVEIGKGLTESEQFGAFAEAIPAGELAKFIPGISNAERPSDNVQTVLKKVRVYKTRATDIESKVRRGSLTRAQADARLDQIEREIQADESRMRLLIQNSPELKFNSDGVNFIEAKLLEARERVFDGRIAAIDGITQDNTELDMLRDLNGDVEADDYYDIPGL